MTETAKFRVYLTVANHRLSQFRNNPDLRDAVLNATVLVALRLDENDIHEFQKRMRRVDRVYRLRGHGEWEPVSDFILQARDHLAERLEAYKKLQVQYKDASHSDQYQSYERRINEITDALVALENENIGVDALSEIAHKEFGKIQSWRDSSGILHEDKGTRLFRDIEFKEQEFPTYKEFADLETHHAFIRIDRGSEVYKVETPPPPPEDATVRQRSCRNSNVATMSVCAYAKARNKRADTQRPNMNERHRHQATVRRRKRNQNTMRIS
jgi:hypothetical protein